MARRTKEESLATRSAIVAAAREMFHRNGVANTSLEQIAEAAGVTRGAIYWHFCDKAALFYAMRDAVQLPLIDRSNQLLEARTVEDPLDRVEQCIVGLLDSLIGCEMTRQTLWIMTFQCEYVGEFARDLDVACAMHEDLKKKFAACYREARRKGLLRSDLTPAHAALDSVAFVAGLIRIWILDQNGTFVRRGTRRLIADHVRGKRAAAPPAQRARVSRAVATS
jgi:TetR/AcrR family acrAB operon transcriptional repressor